MGMEESQPMQTKRNETKQQLIDCLFEYIHILLLCLFLDSFYPSKFLYVTYISRNSLFLSRSPFFVLIALS
jgi:hypothetical protein